MFVKRYCYAHLLDIGGRIHDEDHLLGLQTEWLERRLVYVLPDSSSGESPLVSEEKELVLLNE